MQIAVSASEGFPNSNMDPRCGRCAGSVLFDSAADRVDDLEDGAQRELARGLGIQAAVQALEGNAMSELDSGTLQAGPGKRGGRDMGGGCRRG